MVRLFGVQNVYRAGRYDSSKGVAGVNKTRQQIIQEAMRIKGEIEQIFTDVSYWNQNVRTEDEAVINPDPDGQLATLLMGLNRMLERELQLAQNKHPATC